IDKVDEWIYDSKSFVFSLESNGRIEGMMKFDIIEPEYAFWIPKKNETFGYLFAFGHIDIDVYNKSRKSVSNCHQKSFNYKGMKNALRGKDEYFCPKHIIIVEMK
ncbi:Hypothetical protein EHI5A_200360, partial [Entamoeba histolytica KU27]